MIDILTIVAPIFIVIAVGYAGVQLNIVDKVGLAAVGRFVLYFAFPSLIVITLAKPGLVNAIEPLFLAAYGGGMLLTYGLMFAFSRAAMRDVVTRAGVKSLGASFSNSAFVGYPLLLQAFDTPPITTFAMALMFENVVMMPLVLSVLELGAGKPSANGLVGTARMVAKRVATNPIIIAIVIGITLAAFEMRPPAVIAGSLGLLGKASAGAALFFVGGSLVGNAIRGNMADISQIAAAKLIIHPLLVVGLIAILPAFDPELQQAAVLIAACPMLSIFPILSSKYGFAQLASSALLVTTTLSFASISIVLALL